MFNRAGQRGRSRSTQIEVWPAPRRGWIASERIVGANREGAEILDNVFPTAEGGKVRRGCVLYATLPTAAKQMMAYISGSQQLLIGSTASAIYDLTSVPDETTAPAPVLSGFTDGSWSYAQFGTSGGEFMWMVNGEDSAVLFDGTDWNPINAAAVNDLAYDGATEAFAAGEVVTGGTSGATATILAIVPTTAATGVLKIGPVTGGPFQDNEALTGATVGDALANGAEASASSLAVTGVATSALSFVWPHKGRLWFVEGGTLKAWYLAAGSIAGAATAFSLQGVFQYGGALLVGGTISMDSGAGLDDRAVFITTEGEVAVYAGTDPSSANTWGLEGVFRIGKPLSRHAWFKAGGDLVICTEDGVVSIMQAMARDRAALMEAAVTAPIEDAWQSVVSRRRAAFPFTATLWHPQTTLIIGAPTEDGSKPQAFVANTRTGAWCRYTGWDVRCSVVHQDRLYFGQNDGRVALAEQSGQDFDQPYFATWVPKFSECGTSDDKFAISARLMLRIDAPTRFRVTGLANYELGALQLSAVTDAEGFTAWGTGVWGTSIWGGSRNALSQSQWQSISGAGFSLSPGVQIGVGRISEPQIEIASVMLQYEVGNPL